jgi:hypothetical protein
MGACPCLLLMAFHVFDLTSALWVSSLSEFIQFELPRGSRGTFDGIMG